MHLNRKCSFIKVYNSIVTSAARKRPPSGNLAQGAHGPQRLLFFYFYSLPLLARVFPSLDPRRAFFIHPLFCSTRRSCSSLLLGACFLARQLLGRVFIIWCLWIAVISPSAGFARVFTLTEELRRISSNRLVVFGSRGFGRVCV